jgi:hypothetical protein
MQHRQINSTLNALPRSCKQQGSRKQQAGASLIGAAFVVALVLFLLVVAMKIAPAYVEHNNVRNILRTMGTSGTVSGMSKKEIMEAFEKRKNIDDITSVSGRDLDIATDEAGNTVITAQYQVVRPVMGNLSVLIDFDASSARK